MQPTVFASFLFVALAIQQASAATIYRAGNASKAYPKVRTPQDYNNPNDKGLITADPKKGASTNSVRSSVPGGCKKNCWSIDSSKFFNNLKAVNDHDTHWAITLVEDTNIDTLLTNINDAGWTKEKNI